MPFKHDSKCSNHVWKRLSINAPLDLLCLGWKNWKFWKRTWMEIHRSIISPKLYYAKLILISKRNHPNKVPQPRFGWTQILFETYASPSVAINQTIGQDRSKVVRQSQKYQQHLVNNISATSQIVPSAYRKASSRGAYGHGPFWSAFEEHRLDSTTTDITMALFIL